MAYIDYTVTRRFRGDDTPYRLTEIFYQAPCFAALQHQREEMRYAFSDIENIKLSLEGLRVNDIKLIKMILDDFGYQHRYYISIDGSANVSSIFQRFLSVSEERPMVNIFMLYTARFFIENGQGWIATIRDLVKAGVKPSLAMLIGTHWQKSGTDYRLGSGGHGYLPEFKGMRLSMFKESFPLISEKLDTSPLPSKKQHGHTGFSSFLGRRHDYTSNIGTYICEGLRTAQYSTPRCSLDHLVNKCKQLEEEMYG